MQPAKIEGSTHTLRAPDGWDHENNGRCGALHVRAEEIEDTGFLRSAWDVNPDEAGWLLAGSKMVLGIAGPVHPVVHMVIPPPPEDHTPVVTARHVTLPDGTDAMRIDMFFRGGKSAFAITKMGGLTRGEAIRDALDVIEGMPKQEGRIA